MATESIQVSGVINATPDRIYSAWLDSTEHSLFTGGKASVEPSVGGRFTAWDGYIQGTNLELQQGRRILQAWRSTEFPAGSSDSHLEVLLEPVEGGTRMTLIHTDIPEGMAANLEQGWREHYLSPMAKYFGVPGGVESVEAEDLVEMEEAPVVVKKAPAPKPAAKKKAKPRKAPKRKAKAKKKAARPKKSAKKAARKAPKRKRAKARGSKRRTRRR